MGKYMKLVQCDIGHYNLLGGEDLLFTLVICNEDDSIAQRAGYDCKINVMCGEDTEYYKSLFQSAWEDGDIIRVIAEAFPIVRRFVGSDRLKQLLAFAREFEVNHKELMDRFISDKKHKLLCQIEELTVKHGTLENDVTDEEVEGLTKEFVDAYVSDYHKWAKEARERLKDFKKKTEGYVRTSDEMKKWEERASKYEQFLNA